MMAEESKDNNPRGGNYCGMEAVDTLDCSDGRGIAVMATAAMKTVVVAEVAPPWGTVNI